MKDDENRRWWPVRCRAVAGCGRHFDFPGLKAVRDQLWAEAVVRYGDGSGDNGDGGEAWWLSRGEEAELRIAQGTFAASDQWAPAILEYLAGRSSPVSVVDVLTGPLRVPMPDVGRGGYAQRVATVLKRAMWQQSKRIRRGHVQVRLWFPPEATAETMAAFNFAPVGAPEPPAHEDKDAPRRLV